MKLCTVPSLTVCKLNQKTLPLEILKTALCKIQLITDLLSSSLCDGF